MCISLPRSQTAASERRGRDTGTGVQGPWRDKDLSGPTGQFPWCKLVCALCRETQLQVKLA